MEMEMAMVAVFISVVSIVRTDSCTRLTLNKVPQNMANELQMRIFPLGDYQTNCFVVRASGESECWIIDAGYRPQAMIDWIESEGLSPSKLILTHAHADHIGGVPEIRAKWPRIPILIHEAENAFLTTPELNLSIFTPPPLVVPEATENLKPGDKLTLGSLTFEVRETPGHSPGGISLIEHDQHVAFVGDALFAGSIGRYDFPTSDGHLLMKSIHEQLLSLPDETDAYPGHGPATTIGRERISNPYLR